MLRRRQPDIVRNDVEPRVLISSLLYGAARKCPKVHGIFAPMLVHRSKKLTAITKHLLSSPENTHNINFLTNKHIIYDCPLT